MDNDDQAAVPPSQYSEATSAQYAGPAYDFPADAHHYIAIDQTLEGSIGYQTHGGKAHDAQSSGHISLPHQNGHIDPTDPTHIPTSHIDPAPPVTPHSNASTKRKSPDGITDSTSAPTDSKRKRSKVSRACDQCRRKKVPTDRCAADHEQTADVGQIRCDADADGTNELKTCSNCLKIDQECQWSRVPQKRGPSKGYIKELSDRLQQVEGQLDYQNSAGYRASLDSQSGAYSDVPFSPDDDPSHRRGVSFSQQRSPFAESSKDRFGSYGGWQNSAVTSAPRNQSIAIPPDQLVSPQDKPPSAHTMKPFWTEYIEPPSKKPNSRMESVPHDISAANRTALLHYYDNIHPLCPILPDNDTTATIDTISHATKAYCDAFLYAINQLPHKKQDPAAEDPTRPDVQHDPAWLRTFINKEAREPFASRANIDSLVLLWTQLILLVVMRHDVNTWCNCDLPACDAIRMSLDQCDEYFKTKPYISETHDDVAWSRAAHISSMFGRLYAISKGQMADPVPLAVCSNLDSRARTLPPRAWFMVMMADFLQASLYMLPETGRPVSHGVRAGMDRVNSSHIRAWLSAAGLDQNDPIVLEIKAFGELLSLRCNANAAQPKPAIVGPVVNLAEAIRQSTLAESEMNNGRYIYNLLSPHTMTVATITLLELLQCEFDDPISGPLIADALAEMCKTLATMVEKRSQLDGGAVGLYWAEVLIQMVEEKVRDRNDVSAVEGRTEDVVVIDLTLLLQRGYINAVVDYASAR